MHNCDQDTCMTGVFWLLVQLLLKYILLGNFNDQFGPSHWNACTLLSMLDSKIMNK